MPVKPLPPDADLNHLKYQAKDLSERAANVIRKRRSEFGNFIRDSSPQQMGRSSMPRLIWPTRNSRLPVNEDLQAGRN